MTAKNDAIAYIQSIAVTRNSPGWSEGAGRVSGVQHRCDMHAGSLMIYLL